ncbi:hypothetical protein ACUNV4_27720 [Granulosicoccus sp. 3-233]|uniref:hypothetical protein n=1 Tax=Granulosicoccus sp. 3-233 TaxID=3417969 RepID=UPI003D33BE4A
MMRLSAISLKHRFHLFRPGLTLLLSSVLLLGLSACSSDDDDDSGMLDDAATLRHELAADPNGIWWDAREATLYATDNDSNQILQFAEDGSLTPFASLGPVPEAGADVSQLFRDADGSFWTPRFGFGTAGTVLQIKPDRSVVAYSELDAERRRIGLTRTTEGEWLVSWFVRGGTGGVSRLIPDTVAGTAVEIDLIVGFYKPTGIAVVGRTLYVNDQGPGELRSFDLDAVLGAPTTVESGTVLTKFTEDESTDLMISDGDANLYFGSRAGKLFQVALDGMVTPLMSGLKQIRGVALDSAGRRLLAVEHSPDTETEGPHGIVIVPLGEEP